MFSGRRADRAYHPRIPTYFIVGMFSYLLGLGVTYLALYFMDRAQPALLYINPIISVCMPIQALLTPACACQHPIKHTNQLIIICIVVAYW